MPRVSVVMPVFNEEKFVSEAIESILTQTFTDFEFLIIDDGSSDRSLEIAETYSRTDPRIVLLSNAVNIGLVETLNKGILEAKGDWILRMDADDISLPDRIEKQIAFSERNPAIDVISTGMDNISMEGKKINSRVLPSSPNELAWRVPFASPAFHGTVLIRKSIVSGVGGYSAEFLLEDNYLWSRLLLERKAQFSSLSETLYLYRRDPAEFNDQLSKRREATRKVCIHFIEKVVGYSVSDEIYSLMSGTAPEETISIPVANQAIYVLFDLFQKMKAAGMFPEEDDSQIQQDVSLRASKILLNTVTFSGLAESLSVSRLHNIIWPGRRHPRLLKWLLVGIVRPKLVIKNHILPAINRRLNKVVDG